MPLVLFFSLAFTTSVTLVINTGEVTSRRIQAQNATDAAAAAGGATLARGMNYIAQNNVTMAKVVASMAILNALERAIEDALKQADYMERLGKLLQKYPKTRPLGEWMEKQIKFIERPRLLLLRLRLRAVRKVWTPALVWSTLRTLSEVGDALFEIAPLTAQHAAQHVYLRNIGHPDLESLGVAKKDVPSLRQRGQIWMFPLYPRVPACRMTWGDLAEKTTFYANRWRESVLAWGAPLILSNFNAHFSRRLQEELDRLFAGTEPGDFAFEARVGETHPIQQKIRELEAQLDQLETQLGDLEDERDAVLTRLRGAFGTQREQLEDQLRSIDRQIGEVTDQIEEIKRRIQALVRQIAAIIRGIKDGPANDGLPSSTPDAAAIDLHPDIHPYFLRTDGFPGTFTYFAAGVRQTDKPMVPVWFNRPEKVGQAVTIAAVRLYNLTKADLWTPDWRVKLVRVRAEDLETQLQRPPSTCAGQPDEFAAERELERSGLRLPPPWLRQRVRRGELFRDDVVRH